MTRGSGVTLLIAVSNVARLMPLACASGHSSLTKAAKDCSCAHTGVQHTMKVRRRARKIMRAIRYDSYLILQQRHQTAAVPLEPSRDFEFQQHHAHDGWACLRQPHQVVDRDRCRPEQPADAR